MSAPRVVTDACAMRSAGASKLFGRSFYGWTNSRRAHGLERGWVSFITKPRRCAAMHQHRDAPLQTGRVGSDGRGTECRGSGH